MTSVCLAAVNDVLSLSTSGIVIEQVSSQCIEALKDLSILHSFRQKGDYNMMVKLLKTCSIRSW